jgi:ArsR family transcriptional regulator
MNTDVLKAMADDNRLTILKLLSGGERCLCEVSEALGISAALASHHVKKLAEAGLVRTRRQGLWLHCSLNEPVLRELAADISALADEPAALSGACCTSAKGVSA